MTVKYLLIGFALMVAALAGICFLTLWLRKVFPSTRFDERQKIARGDAYRFAFWVGFWCYVGVTMIMIRNVEHEPVVEPYLLMCAVMGIQAIAFHMYCRITGSALPFDEKPLVPCIGYAFIAAMNLWQCFHRGLPEKLSLLGTETDIWVNLIPGLFFGTVSVMYGISMLIREKE